MSDLPPDPPEKPLPEPFEPGKHDGVPVLRSRRQGPRPRELIQLAVVLAFAILVLLCLALWKQHYDSTLLAEARLGNTLGVTTWLQKGADVNARDSAGMTPLMLAAAQGHQRTVRVLLSHGADPTLKNKAGLTALALAEANHQTNVVAILMWLGGRRRP